MPALRANAIQCQRVPGSRSAAGGVNWPESSPTPGGRAAASLEKRIQAGGILDGLIEVRKRSSGRAALWSRHSWVSSGGQGGVAGRIFDQDGSTPGVQ